jgi:HAD superfamily hydrolase (TIGR01509 family)
MQSHLLIFDLDGVLVESEKISERLFIQCLQEDGFAVDTAFNSQYFLGRSLRDCLDTLQEQFGRQPSVDVLQAYDEMINEALRVELEPILFVPEALPKLSHPKCVASGSELKRIKLSLEVTGLSPYFQNITSSYEVENGKPAPDVFLKAAEKNSYAPEHCIVIEDSTFGVQAGVAAGMKVLCYQPPGCAVFDVPEGVTLFDSMKDLPVMVYKITH